MFKIGDKVTYVPKNEQGIVKSLSDTEHVFVVYHCDNNWSHYEDYTAARTRVEDLVLGWPTYKIVRKYADDRHPDHNKVIGTGLTLEEAQSHCKDPSTSEKGVWFDVYYEE